MFAEELRRAATAAPLERLDVVLSALWQAFGAGGVDEAEAAEIEALVQARRRAAAPRETRPRRIAAPRARPTEDVERRRRLVASGWLPPFVASRFTPGESAALAVVSREIARKGLCTLCHKQVADLAGVGVTTVRNALRQARLLGLVRVEERRLSADRSDSNVVRVANPEWESWLRLRGRARDAGGGVKRPTPSNTQELRGRKARPGPNVPRLPGGRRDPASGGSGTDVAAGGADAP
jgi:hypothetical protein